MLKVPAFKDILKALGIVFGDIGTSPIYAFTATFTLLAVTLSNVLGVISLFIWTLILIVTVQYAWLAMSLGKETEDEGGLIVLKEVLAKYLKSKKTIFIATILAFIGVAFFIGDGVITPAISILSAVEGLKLITFLGGIGQGTVVIISLIIASLLFFVQKRGIENISLAFGPIMLIWFIFLTGSGLHYVIKFPIVLKAFNPVYGLQLVMKYKFLGILVLSKVILCATGAEALYADMGHIGRKPIVWAWSLVFVALSLIYLGQGSFLLANTKASDLFYEMALSQFKFLYPGIVFLSILATIIASQAMISGIFSIIYQGITTKILPRFYVEYTSKRLMSQIYIPAINAFLFVCVFFVITIFQDSQNLTSAYGFAASVTITINAILLTWTFLAKRSFLKSLVAIFLILVNLLFLVANIYKIPQGAYWSIIIACIPLVLIFIYTAGRNRLKKSLRQMPLSIFTENFSMLFQKAPRINGTAVFLLSDIDTIPTYIVQTMFNNNIMYEENIFVVINFKRQPFGMTAKFKEDLAPGLHLFEINIGYLEPLEIEKIFTVANIYPKVIFYGDEEIQTSNPFWKIFSTIRSLMPSFVQFYKLPRGKLHGVIVRANM